MWFSGLPVQECNECFINPRNKQKQYTDEDVDKFIEDNRGLMDDLTKLEELDKMRNRLQELKSAHELLGILIQELENEIQNQKS